MKTLTFNATAGGFQCGLSLSPDLSVTALYASTSMSSQSRESIGTPGIRFRGVGGAQIARFWDSGVAQVCGSVQADANLSVIGTLTRGSSSVLTEATGYTQVAANEKFAQHQSSPSFVGTVIAE